MDREITEGFDTAFAEIGLEYDTMTSMNKIADTVSTALYELDEIMREHDLYEKYPMNDKFGKECTVFEEYEKRLADNMKDAITMKDADGYEFFTSVVSMGQNIAESSLKSITEVLQETLGKEYGIEFSHTDIYHDSKLMVGKYEYTGDGDIREAVEEALEKAEHGNER
ncbi:MAG: hypothetical protein K2K02_01535 [Ruminococcus sp.]|nr:hypothetical protein [Ruminococcus sp.]